MTNIEQVRAVLNSPCTSYWLKDALTAALKRDCVDVAHDATELARILNERVASMQPH